MCSFVLFRPKCGFPQKNATPAPRERQRQLIDHQRPEGCSIRRGCEVIELPRSTYYYRSTAKAAAISDACLIEWIDEIHIEFAGYGYRRVSRELCKRGHRVNHKRVARVMKAHGLGIKPRRRFVRTTDSDHDFPVFANLYRNVIPAKPDVVWVADITYIRLANGFCFLAAILDACSRRVIGYALSRQIDTPLALAALKAAVENRRPPPGTCIHHSDRGSMGEFNRSSQHFLTGGCDGCKEAKIRSCWACKDEVTRAAACHASIRAPAVLAGDRPRVVERRGSPKSWGVAGGWTKMVSGVWRNAPITSFAVGANADRTVFVAG